MELHFKCLSLCTNVLFWIYLKTRHLFLHALQPCIQIWKLPSPSEETFVPSWSQFSTLLLHQARRVFLCNTSCNDWSLLYLYFTLYGWSVRTKLIFHYGSRLAKSSYVYTSSLKSTLWTLQTDFISSTTTDIASLAASGSNAKGAEIISFRTSSSFISRYGQISFYSFSAAFYRNRKVLFCCADVSKSSFVPAQSVQKSSRSEAYLIELCSQLLGGGSLHKPCEDALHPAQKVCILPVEIQKPHKESIFNGWNFKLV